VIDPLTVTEQLKAAGELDSVGGMAFLAELLDSVPTAANLAYHAQLVLDRFAQRRLIEAGGQIIRDAYECAGDVPVAELVDRSQQRLHEIAVGGSADDLRWIRKDLGKAFEDIERWSQTPGGITGVASGFPDLDNMTGGFQRGDLILLAARPSMGKTALATGVALHAAIAEQAPVALFSLEMSRDQLTHRMLCHEALVDLGKLRRGQIGDDDIVRLAQAAGHINTAPIFVNDRSGVGVPFVRSRVRKLKAEKPNLGLVIVDYIQLMAGGGKAENRQQEVSEISRGLKGLAKDLDVPVLALSQLSRACEERTDHRPLLSDLRESGALEQDADLVMFLYRPEKYMKDSEADEKHMIGHAELNIAKQRNGPTGTVNLYFRQASTRFESAARQDIVPIERAKKPERAYRNPYEREEA